MGYAATYESIAEHAVPDWYHDAKLGIFVHWGLYSVPAWAPRGGDIRERVAEDGWAELFRQNPYAEWYQNTLRQADSPTRRYHEATWGRDFAYEDFAPLFEEAGERVDPEAWARLFARIGARYVVLTTKHHEGFLLWPSKHTSPHRPDAFAAPRDLVGEITSAARDHGLRAGYYYSGGLDWTFEKRPIRGYMDVYETICQDPGFVEYAGAHWEELIERYAPSILWNDIGSPRAQDLPALFSSYYEHVPDGLVNDRWGQELPTRVPGPGELINPPAGRHFDFTTPEYATYDQLISEKWEASRGLGHSYGYNQAEGAEDHLSVERLVHLLADIVSKNGNLLLNVGPTAEGIIPELQLERLMGLGAWLGVNGEAIFGTRPWDVAEGRTGDGLPVRFTKRGGIVYAIVLGTPGTRDLVIEGLEIEGASLVRLLGHEGELAHRQDPTGMTVGLPRDLERSPALALAFGPPLGAALTSDG